MQGPIVDVVLLLLLILFFGVQQRTRPQIHFRFWFVGWIFVFCGYAVWAVGTVPPHWVPVQNAACFDFMLLGALTFLLSLVAMGERLRKVVQVGAAIGIVNVLIIDAQGFVTVPKMVLVLSVLLWQADGFYIAYKLLPREWTRTRWLILAICVLYGIAMLAYVLFTSSKDLDNWVMVEVLLCAAVMYAGSKGGKGVAGYVGTVGFAAWATFYMVSTLLADSSKAQTVLNEFWNFPKYFVGFSMILKVFEDTAEEKERIADEFRELYEEFRAVFLSHPYPMLVYETSTEKFLGVNAAAANAYGYTEAEFLRMTLRDLEDREEVETEHVLPEEEEGRHARYRHKNGNIAWVHVTDRSILFRGKHSRFVIARDVTERLKLDEELSHRAHHDVLTGLPNRQLLADRLAQCLKSCEREQRRAAILTIDVDHFKMINDTYGHLVGDECLRQVAERLKSKIRKVDTIARTGGEEFMAVVSGLNHASDAEKVAEALLRVFDLPLNLTIGEVRMTVSIGVAVYPDDALDAEALRSLSDEAVYRAKRDGRNRAAFGREMSLLESYAPGVIAAQAAAARLRTL
jgi:diguanylate cyclase (GGDEF)-like protein/PAS domain S-box-containing protein